MATSADTPAVPEPFPIFKLAQRYLLYDADTVAYARREHNISGVLVGGLAQAPQQNVFLGLPLELLPEEARLLVEKGVSYIVDDVADHKRGFLHAGLSSDERRAYHAALRKQGLGAARDVSKRSDNRKKAALSKNKADTQNWNDVPDDMLKPGRVHKAEAAEPHSETQAQLKSPDDDESLFASEDSPKLRKHEQSRTSISADVEPFAVTPTTSYPPLRSVPAAAESDTGQLPDVPQSYAIFRYLHDQGYFLAPGLRFGCQYMAYPGDPLRFHSHFLVNGMDWDQEFDLLDLVAGGRLGTGVKKGFMLGGHETTPFAYKVAEQPESGDETRDGVRAFTIEWGGM